MIAYSCRMQTLSRAIAISPVIAIHQHRRRDDAELLADQQYMQVIRVCRGTSAFVRQIGSRTGVSQYVS
jgi:hypothetical protein